MADDTYDVFVSYSRADGNGGADGTRWYYNALAEVFSKAMPDRSADRLSRSVTAFFSLSACKAFVP